MGGRQMKLKATILASVAAIAMPLSAVAADLTLRFGHVGNPGSLFEASANAFAECANGKLGDRGRGANLRRKPAG